MTIVRVPIEVISLESHGAMVSIPTRFEIRFTVRVFVALRASFIYRERCGSLAATTAVPAHSM